MNANLKRCVRRRWRRFLEISAATWLRSRATVRDLAKVVLFVCAVHAASIIPDPAWKKRFIFGVVLVGLFGRAGIRKLPVIAGVDPADLL